jgi:RNA polymerase sigma-70 factor (ECF subfamily)
MKFQGGATQQRAYTGPRADSRFGPEFVGYEQGISRLGQEVTQLFEQLRGSIYRYVISIIENPSEAEEITQDVFLQLYRCLDDGQKIANFRAWTFRVAHNLALNHKDATKYVVRLELTAWHDLCELRQDPDPNPEQSLLRQEQWQRFNEAVGHLTLQQKECLILKAEGVRYAQIAEILGISVANVAQSVRRGIKRLMRNAHA